MLCAAAVSLGLAACGGDDGDDRAAATTTTKAPLSGKALAAAANAVCTAHDAPRPATSDIAPFDRFVELKAPYAGDQRRAVAAAAALRRIDAATADRQDLKNLADVIRVIAVFDEVAGDAGDVAEFGAVAPRVVNAYKVAFKYADAIGAQACPPLPESGAYVAAVKQAREEGRPAPPLPKERTPRRTGSRRRSRTRLTRTRPRRDAPPTRALLPTTRPTTVLGGWRGKVTQYGPGDQRARYVVELDVASIIPGEDGGRSSYPRYDCDGALRTSSGSRDESVAVFREEIVRGKKRCYGNQVATVRVQLTDAGDRLAWRWRGRSTKGTPIEALGTLRRCGSRTARHDANSTPGPHAALPHLASTRTPTRDGAGRRCRAATGAQPAADCSSRSSGDGSPRARRRAPATCSESDHGDQDGDDQRRDHQRRDERADRGDGQAGGRASHPLPAQRAGHAQPEQRVGDQVDGRAGDHHPQLGARQLLGRVGDHQLVAGRRDDHAGDHQQVQVRVAVAGEPDAILAPASAAARRCARRSRSTATRARPSRRRRARTR